MAFIKRVTPGETSPPIRDKSDAARTAKPEIFKTESDLCALFIREFSTLDCWTCYPEAGGFDVLVVHEDGRQIGVEAKLVLNAKVADQILPARGGDYHQAPGPDYRLVIVSKISDSNAGIAKMLEMMGVLVLCPYTHSTPADYTFGLEHVLLEAKGHVASYTSKYLFDWNPAERCQVPLVVGDLPAGVPAPRRLTPWKESALRVVALMRRQGTITSKQIADHGIGTGYWTQPYGERKAWLAKGPVRGQWVETEHMPPFDKQHPEAYAQVLQELANTLQGEFTLT